MINVSLLSSALRSNLISIQKTQKLIDETTLRLATGLKVNSAVDDPQNFFAARALNARASDLRARLDGIGQSIRALEETQNGLDAALEILDLAEAYLEDVIDRYLAGEIALNDQPAGSNVTEVRPTASDFTGYAGFQDSGGPVTVTNGGADFTLDGNLWKQLALDYTVTADTVLEFEYASTLTPEISAIGFDTDSSFPNDSNRFFLNGTQFSGISYAAPTGTFQYTGAGAYQTYEIPVGTFFTGTFDRLTFINDDDSGPTGNALYRNVSLREGPAVTTPTVEVPPELQEDYQIILDQLDQIAKDAQYRGINLLKEETLKTIFNETGSSHLETEGIDSTSFGLGLLAADFNSIQSVRDKLEKVERAREVLRQYNISIALDLGIIKTRETFVRETIINLLKGRDDLTVADQNEEGAKLLALQARQSLGTISLSIAAESSRGIVDLFA